MRSMVKGWKGSKSTPPSGLRPATSPFRGGAIRLKRAPPRKPRAGAQFLLYPQQLVVLGRPVRPREAARLDLAAGERDREVGNRRILRLAGAVRHHRRVA